MMAGAGLCGMAALAVVAFAAVDMLAACLLLWLLLRLRRVLYCSLVCVADGGVERGGSIFLLDAMLSQRWRDKL